MPLLSIITINLNNAQGLENTIRSVINQSYTNIEYIIIDGGSTDNSTEVIKSFTEIPPNKHNNDSKNELINYWISEPDTGIYNAMNKGIKQASGDYIQFLNSGDCLVNHDVTGKMMNNIGTINIVYGNMIKQLKSSKILHNKKVNLASFHNLYKGSLNHSSAYINRNLFDKYGLYDENLKIVSDWKFFLIAIGLNNESVMYKDIDVCVFNMHGISNTNKYLEKKEREMVLQEYLPKNILNDYNNYSHGISFYKRINRYNLRFIQWIFERVLFQIEKLETRLKGYQILD